MKWVIKTLIFVRYFPPVNSLLKQKRAMLHIIKKPRGLQLRRYAARLIDLNKYLTSFPGDNFSENWINWIEYNFV